MYIKNEKKLSKPTCKLQSEKKPDDDCGHVAPSTRKSYAQQYGTKNQSNSTTSTKYYAMILQLKKIQRNVIRKSWPSLRKLKSMK